jgi:hypothetical protein
MENRDAYPPSPVPADSDLWPDELPFTAFGQWGQDYLDLRVFEQDTWWVDRTGRPHLLSQMSAEYRANVLAHVIDNAPQFHLGVIRKEAIQMVGDVLYGLPPAELLVIDAGGIGAAGVSAAVWLESTPLVRKLRALIGDGP